ncbi:MAG: hypothetical protein ACTSR2_08995 [Candidatus Hodarchaeales archaeon]
MLSYTIKPASNKSNFSKNQTVLHQQLKTLYLKDLEGVQEASLRINGLSYRIDVYNKTKNIICEIQRNNFGKKFSSKIKNILAMPESKVIIVCPVVIGQKVTRKDNDRVISVSYTQRKLFIYSLFDELVRIKLKFLEGRMVFHILLIREHLTKQCVNRSFLSKRRRYKTIQRELIEITERRVINKKEDFLGFLPPNLPKQFTNKEVTARLQLPGLSYRLKAKITGKMTYSLWKLGIIKRIGKKGNAYLYELDVNTDN